MAIITPNTDLYLLKVPLEINDINQLDFANASAQYNYFSSLPKVTVDDFTYQRKDNVIRFPMQMDEIITYNYCMYRNTEYSDKWFYAYITNMEYVNDNMTLISIKTDTWQTWQFSLNYKPCLVEREHTNDDTVGSNTLPENLELGEFVCNGDPRNFEYPLNYCVVVEVSQIENTGDGNTLSHEWEDGGGVDWDTTPSINGMIRGTTPLIVDYGDNSPTFDSIRRIYDDAGLGDSIVNVYPLPRVLQTYDGANIDSHSLTLKLTNSLGTEINRVEHIRVLTSSSSVVPMGTYTFSKPTSLAGNYVPVNKKLLTFPFCYFNISNNAGTSIPYHYEDFDSENVQFKTRGVFCIGGSIKAIPVNYKNIVNDTTALGNALDFSVSGAKYPVGSWKSDSYTNWLTQNSVNMETQWRRTALSAMGMLVGGAWTGGVGGAILGGIAGAKDLMSVAREQHLAKTQANFVPDQVHGNINAGDYLWSRYRTPFTYLSMSIKPEYARCIDEFFSQFGYACNRVKIPNITGRRNWNYVKTIGCYIEADIPQDDLSEIKDMFDRGITIWHNPATFADYSQNNDII